jgi:hypothetical protein
MPIVSHTYVNNMLHESHHFIVLLSKGSFSNLSQPFYSWSLDFHESVILRIQSSLDSKSTKFDIYCSSSSNLSMTVCRRPWGSQSYTPIILLPEF